MERGINLSAIALEIEKLIRRFGRRKDIVITFSCLSEESAAEFSTWDRERFNLRAGDEYFFVWEALCGDVADPDRLLYVVNVSADSLLTAASELMSLASRKF